MSTPTPRPLVAGNWKMNGLRASIGELDAVLAGLSSAGRAEAAICPPATLVAAFAERTRGSALAIGGQDCHFAPGGAHTGDVSAEMLADAGASYVIVGHSERRMDHHETDALVGAKAAAAWRAGLTAIICVGESEAQRDAGQAEAVVRLQLEGSIPAGARAASTVVAYEPVWAIGTGRTPAPADIAAMHLAIRGRLTALLGAEGAGMRILYGGSVKPENAGEIFSIAHVNGGLVGGASLKAGDFLQILRAAG